jgi:hypothetical protein
MADSLVLSGVKHIKKQTGDEMLRLNPKRGGDSHQLKRWWVTGGNGTVYTGATVFKVSGPDGDVKLAIETTVESNIRIIHDGSYNFTFANVNEVKRAALFTDSYELIEHYVFPAISGGKVMTVTPASAGDRPAPAVVVVDED